MEAQLKNKYTFRFFTPKEMMGDMLNTSTVISDTYESAQRILRNSYKGITESSYELVSEEPIELYKIVSPVFVTDQLTVLTSEFSTQEEDEVEEQLVE